MCRPSATSAIEPKTSPPMISATIMRLHSTMTNQVRRSLRSWPAPRNTCGCAEGGAVSLVLMIAPQVRLHRIDELSGATRPRRIAGGMCQGQPQMILDYFRHEPVHGPAGRHDQMQHGGAAHLI